MDLTFILKIVVLVLGALTVGLTALTFSKPFPHPQRGIEGYVKNKQEARQSSQACEELREKMGLEPPEKQVEWANSHPSTCVVKKHVVLDEIILSIIVIVFIISIVVSIFSCISNNPEKINTNFYIVAGLFLLVMGILWFFSVGQRTYKQCTQTNAQTNASNPWEPEDPTHCKEDKEKEVDIGEFYGNNKIELNLHELQKKDKDENKIAYLAEGTFALVIVDGILILVNALLYIGIGVLTSKRHAGGGQVTDYHQEAEQHFEEKEEPYEVLGLD